MFLSTMRKLESEYHSRCWFKERMGDVPIAFDADGGMTAVIACGECYSGYEGRLHGGVISALFDWAMTHCLFGRGIKAYTARLKVKYSRPVVTGMDASINATVEEKIHERVWRVGATLLQQGKVCASADALFWEETEGDGAGGSK